MAMTQVSYYLNMHRYTQTVMCAVNNVNSSDKERERERKNRLADTNIQIRKVEEWFAPITGSENAIFCASPGKYKTIILHYCLSYSLTLILFFFLPSTLSLRLPLCGAARRSCHFSPGVFAYLYSSSRPDTLLQEVFRHCLGFQRVTELEKKNNLRLVYKSLNDLAPRYIADLLVRYEATRALRSSGAGLFAIPRVRTKIGESSCSYYARVEQVTKGSEV